MSWAYGSYVAGRLLVLGATAVLARLLAPADFGLVALALTFLALFEAASDLGLSQALIVADEKELDERAETVFATSVALGAGLALLTAALGPAAAAFFDEGELVALLPVLGLNFLLRSLGTTHFALAQKRLDFRSRTIAELADAVLRGLASIAFALAGLGAWSLVLGYLVGSLTLSVALWLLVPWRPALRPRREHLRDMLRFGGTLSAVRVVDTVTLNVDYVFIGRVLGTGSLGLYTLGFRLPELLVMNLSVVAGEVLFPAFAALDRGALGRAFLFSLRYALMAALPMAALLAVLADPFVLALFGDQWRDSVPAMQVLTLFALAVTITIPGGTVYKTSGRPDIILKLSLVWVVLSAASIAIFVDQGITAVAGCQAAVAGLIAAADVAIAARMTGVGGRPIWAAAWPPLVAAGAMALVLLAVRSAIGPPWPALVAGGALGGAVYLALIWLLAREAIDQLRAMMFPRRGGPTARG